MINDDNIFEIEKYLFFYDAENMLWNAILIVEYNDNVCRKDIASFKMNVLSGTSLDNIINKILNKDDIN